MVRRLQWQGSKLGYLGFSSPLSLAGQTSVTSYGYLDFSAMDVVVQGILPASYYEALERLAYFNRRQADKQGAIVKAIDQYGGLEIVSSDEGIRMRVKRHDQAQCLFALVCRKGRLELGGGLIYLRTSAEELVVLHVAVADRYSRHRRLGLRVLMRLVRAVCAAAKRLRGVHRVSLLYCDHRGVMVDSPDTAMARGDTLSIVEPSSWPSLWRTQMEETDRATSNDGVDTKLAFS
jgi:hypothetical protein